MRVQLPYVFQPHTIKAVGGFLLCNLHLYHFPFRIFDRILPTLLVCKGNIPRNHWHPLRQSNFTAGALGGLLMIFNKHNVKWLIIVIERCVTRLPWMIWAVGIRFSSNGMCCYIIGISPAFHGWLFSGIGGDLLEYSF